MVKKVTFVGLALVCDDWCHTN